MRQVWYAVRCSTVPLAVPVLPLSQQLLRGAGIAACLNTNGKEATLKIRTKIASAALALATIGGVGLVTQGTAHAAYTFPGLSVIDTQASGGSIPCDQWNAGQYGQVDCYTWIRTNGVLRRGSPLDYVSEAQGGYVFALCSAAIRFAPIGSYGPPFGDWYGQPQRPFGYQWTAQPNRHVYCTSPVTPAGYNYAGYAWPDVANGNLQ